MALLRDMYGLANYVYEVQDTPQKLTYSKGGIDIDEAWKQYARVKKISEKDAVYIGASANENGYVTGLGPDKNNIYTAVLKAGKGRDFIDKTFFGKIPKGLWLAWVDKNKDSNSLLIAFVSGILIGVIAPILAVVGFRK